MKLFKKHKPFIIFSVFRGRDAHVDYMDHISVLEHLDRLGIPAQALRGQWEGKAEWSILIDGSRLDVAHTIAHKYNQEALLYVDEKLEAYLCTTGPVRAKQYIGKWTEVSDLTDDEWERDNWTYDPRTGRTYIVT